MAAILKQTTSRSLASDETPQRVADNRPILVATDASASSDAALRAAQALALHTMRGVRIVAVYEPLPIASPEVAVIESPEVAAERGQSLRARVRNQLIRVGVIYDWPIDVVRGDPANVITRVALDSDAAIVVLGLGRHGLLDRIIGSETALRVLRLSSVPVLAVTPAFNRLPLRVLAAMDFSASSVRALSVASQLIHPFGSVSMTHVLVPNRSNGGESTPITDSLNGIDAAFNRVVSDVGLPKSVTITRKVWSGDPAKVLLDVTKLTKPDLIVAGSHGYGFLSRLLMGSVSERLLRDAATSILIAPPAHAPSYMEELPEAIGRIQSYEWSERLEDFTRRNAARRATLEVIDPDIGAQIEEKGFPFVGASYDPRTGHVQILLGDDGVSGRHLSRNIHGVTGIQVLRDRAGRDLLLRVAHGNGQTLLMLER